MKKILLFGVAFLVSIFVVSSIVTADSEKIAEKKRLKPGRVKGASGVQFKKEKNKRINRGDSEVWNQPVLKSRGGPGDQSAGWMKIMKKKRSVSVGAPDKEPATGVPKFRPGSKLRNKVR